MTGESRCRGGRDNRHLRSDTHSGSKCLFSSPRVYRKKTEVSTVLCGAASITPQLLPRGGWGKGQGAGGWGREWTKEEEVGTKMLLQLKSVSSVPEAAGLTGWHDLAERNGIRQSAGVWGGVGWGGG